MRTLLRSLRPLAIVAALALSTGCASYPVGTSLRDAIPEVNATLHPEVIVLQPGDGIQLQFPNNAKYDQTTKVRPDGKAMFLLVGEVEVSGMTVPELQDYLKSEYEKQIIAPELLVRSSGLGNRNIYFAGAVGGQRVLPVAPGMRVDLVEALARIGAPKDTFAMLEHTVLIRWMAEEGKRRSWIIDARPRFWTNPDPLYLQANDIVYVPEHPLRTATQWVREATKLIPLPYLFQITN
ncbi:MAG TPA: hypothetical protein ENJ09_13440 [Planctomycetes bacterium]|nr:hypothetical protein [Planctomycetota bacterium]